MIRGTLLRWAAAALPALATLAVGCTGAQAGDEESTEGAQSTSRMGEAMEMAAAGEDVVVADRTNLWRVPKGTQTPQLVDALPPPPEGAHLNHHFVRTVGSRVWFMQAALRPDGELNRSLVSVGLDGQGRRVVDAADAIAKQFVVSGDKVFYSAIPAGQGYDRDVRVTAADGSGSPRTIHTVPGGESDWRDLRGMAADPDLPTKVYLLETASRDMVVEVDVATGATRTLFESAEDDRRAERSIFMTGGELYMLDGSGVMDAEVSTTLKRLSRTGGPPTVVGTSTVARYPDVGLAVEPGAAVHYLDISDDMTMRACRMRLADAVMTCGPYWSQAGEIGALTEPRLRGSQFFMHASVTVGRAKPKLVRIDL